ncbi:hypothetical protein [Streptomyces sp. NPDC057686]|uniref:hypothetical protein n=1 Tax=Streptomyces sp. NPDC057686 TaxID=3346212 RepID=UPI0036C32BA7
MTPEEKLAHRRRSDKRRQVARDRGRPSNVHPHEFEEAKARIAYLHYQCGMSVEAMGRQVGFDRSTPGKVLHHSKTMHRTTYDRIMRLVYEPPVDTLDVQQLGGQVPLQPTQRRLQALIAAGYHLKYVAEETGCHAKGHLSRIANGKHDWVYSATALRISALYTKLIDVDPVDVGLTPTEILRSQRRAQRQGYAPASCWDDDTINDLDAIPEWTGACGTAEGYRIHKREYIPACKPCCAARRAHERNLYAARYSSAVDRPGGMQGDAIEPVL